MNYLLRLLQRFHLVIIFLVLLGLAVWLYVNTTYYQKARFGKVAGWLSGAVSTQLVTLTNYLSLHETNANLHRENLVLKNQLERYKNVLLQRGQVPQFDSLASRAYSYISARVVNNSTHRQNNFITLDVGSADGVREGMGVVCADGVVGIVASLSQHYATAMSLLNSHIKISAKHSKSGSFGSIMWNGENYRHVAFDDIPLHVQLAVGDTVVTSGYSAIFPPNIPIGAIDEIANDVGNVYGIDIELYADFKRLEYVYVVNAVDHDERNALEQPHLEQDSDD